MLIPLTCLLGVARPKLFLIGIILAGALVAQDTPNPKPFLSDDPVPHRIEARVLAPPRVEGRTTWFPSEVVAIDGSAIPRQRVRLSWFPDEYGSTALYNNLDLGRGDRLAVLVRLRPPVSYRTPGVFDYGRYLETQGVTWIGTIRSPRLIEIASRGWHAPDRLRNWTADRVRRYFSESDRAPVALGMILGQRRTLSPDIERQFEQAGLIHLLVVSGFNLAVVAAAALAVGRWLPLGRHRRTLSRMFAVGVVLAYAALVEGDAPVVRATLMAVILLAGTALDRGYAVGNALALTGLLMLSLDPASINDPGFRLTFTAVVAILAVGAPLTSWLLGPHQHALRDTGNRRLDHNLDDGIIDLRVSLRLRAESRGWPLSWLTLPRRACWLLAEVGMITAAIQVCLIPFAVESHHRLSPVSIPLNLAGALVAGIVTPLGITLIPLPRLVGQGVAWATDLLVGALIGLVDLGLRLPGATMRVPSPPGILWAVFGLGLVMVATGARRRQTFTLSAGATIILAGVLAIAAGDFSPPPPDHPVLTFLDVGQGDSTLIELPDGRSFVVDGGGVTGGGSTESASFRVGEEVVSQYLFHRGFRRIDALVLSHAHHDHLDGLIDLVRNFEIGEVWLGPNPMVPLYRAFLEETFRQGIPVRHLRAGDRTGPFEVLSPSRTYSVSRTVRNDDSLVMLLRWGNTTVLLPGDLEASLDGAPERVDVLKVPHHGSAGTRLATLGRLPIISVGANNRFGHPGANRLPALRTDIVGTIRVTLASAGPRVTFPGLR